MGTKAEEKIDFKKIPKPYSCREQANGAFIDVMCDDVPIVRVQGYVKGGLHSTIMNALNGAFLNGVMYAESLKKGKL